MGKNRRALPVENKFRRQWQAIDCAGLMTRLVFVRKRDMKTPKSATEVPSFVASLP
jgi:hypothetical protein